MKNRTELARLALVLLATLVVSRASRPDPQEAEPAKGSRISPYLLFQDGRAEEAMEFYVGLFDGAEVLRAEKYGPDQAGKEGSLFLGIFEVAGQKVMCTDSVAKPDFDFTPSLSLFVDCTDAEEIERLAAELAEGGKMMMPLDSYGFSEKFAWVEDRYGVSWQLSLDLH